MKNLISDYDKKYNQHFMKNIKSKKVPGFRRNQLFLFLFRKMHLSLKKKPS